MLEACQTEFERRTITLLASTGMHISALPGLKPQNLVVRGGVRKLEWRRPKTKRIISLKVPASMEPWVEEYLAMTGPPRYASDDYYYKLVKAVARRAGLPDVSPMSFRHTAGYRLWKELGPSAPKKVLGVSDRVLATYASLDDEAVDARASDVLSGITKGE